MEQRIDMLERDVSEIKTELAVVRSDYARRELMLAIDQRVGIVEVRLTGIERRLDSIEARLSVIDDRLTTLEIRTARIETQLAAMQARMDQFQVALDKLRDDFEALRVVVMGVGKRLASLEALQHTFATKADLQMLETRMKTWFIASLLTTISVLSGVQFAMFTMLRH
jgi:chromosome segregation ATPase